MPAEIISRPDIHDGEPIISGTRISVFAVKGFASAGYTVRQIMREYPDLTPEQIDAAIAYQPEPTMPADSRDMVIVPRELLTVAHDQAKRGADKAGCDGWRAQEMCRQIGQLLDKALSASPAREGDYGPVISMETRGPVEDARRRREAEDAYYGARWPAPTPATPEGLREALKLRDDLRKFADGCIEARQWGGPTIWPDNPITEARARSAVKALDAILAALQPQAGEGE